MNLEQADAPKVTLENFTDLTPEEQVAALVSAALSAETVKVEVK